MARLVRFTRGAGTVPCSAMNRSTAVTVLLIVGLLTSASHGQEKLADARAKFKTNIVKKTTANEPVEKPPAGVFDLVKYESPAGAMAAYLTPDPKDGKKRPA